ncbi:MAG: KEOPS complex kinase/ATPase Bud32 [Nitrososphaerota archaeon]|nr:Kae1-associated serine/threonine protein kinase [Candidatus Aenigmarchaeota archaeon]
MDILKHGAEAILYLKKYENEIILFKERISKGYRIQILDYKIRTERTSHEAKLMISARKNNINVPKIFFIDKEKFIIGMEFIKGERIKEYLLNCTEFEAKRIGEEIGKIAGKLHASGIIHGDLTTSNMILSGEKIFIIDFGLGFFSKRYEDMATDLMVLKEAITSVHFKYLNTLWENIIKGYSLENKEYKNVLDTLKKIEMRGRYIKRE